MDASMIKDGLMRTAEQMMELADKITEHGMPMEAKDKQLVRQGMLGWVGDILDEAKYFYLIGQAKDFGRGTMQVEELMKMLS